MSVFDIEAWASGRLDRFQASAAPEYTAMCPLCDGWGCFYVNVTTGAFICFKCSGPDGPEDFKGKNIVGLVAQVEDITWSEAQRFVFTNSIELRRKGDVFTIKDRIRGLRVSDDDDEPEEAGPVAFDLPRGFRPVYKGGKWALPAYLKERRIKSRTARRWGMGHCRSGRFAGRLVIPINCPGGFSFTARDMTGEQEPKYLNPTGADHRRLLIGWDVVRPRADFCLVEGPLDAVRLDQHGIPALAIGGLALHSDQLNMLFALPEIAAATVMVDPEADLSPFDIANQLAVHFKRVYIARLPMGVDPGSSTDRQARSAINKAEKFDGSRISRTKVLIKRSRISRE